MNKNNLEEHVRKECLKKVIDTNSYYTNGQKQDLKAIVDSGQTAEQILEGILMYFPLQ